MSARRTTGVVAGVLSVGAIAAAVTVLRLPHAESGDTPDAAAPPATAEIIRETLVDREEHDGTLGYGTTTAVTARSSGTVTSLPATDTTITRGRALYRLDDTPVILLYGSMPAYRTLEPGAEGADVEQFERNLRALGYRGFTVDDTYTSATAAAVEEWQDDLGVRETGTVGPGQIAYASGPVRVDSHTVDTGAVVQPGAGVLKLTGTAPVATVSLDVADRRLARTGSAVEVTLPDGRKVPGRITDVETVVEQGEGPEEGTTTFEVTVRFAGGPKNLDDAAVTVGFAAAERKNVLTVPVAALLALAEGGYGLELIEDTGTRVVAVKTGLFAAGRVEVTGTALRPGLKVGMPA